MSLESATYISQLDPANPSGTDRVAQGDEHLRLLKAVLKATFPNLTGPMTLTQAALNAVVGYTVPIGGIIDWYGSAISVPAGWGICDGTSYTRTDGGGLIASPDLRGLVVAGASTAHPTGISYGQETRAVTSGVAGAHSHTGSSGAAGAHSHSGSVAGTTLSLAQIPAHNHGNGVSDDNAGNIFPYGTKAAPPGGNVLHNGDPYSSQGLTETVGGGSPHVHSISPDGSHDHPVTIDAVAGHTHAVSVDVTQPTASLHKIMKI